MRLIFLICSIFFISCNPSKKNNSESFQRGEIIYQDFCVSCHLPNGKGVDKVFPPLAKSDYLNDVPATIRAIKYGLKGPIVVNGVKYDGIMSPMGLDDQEVADVTHFILNSWGNKNKEEITEKTVTKI